MKYSYLLVALIISISSCKKEGCTNSSALNHSSEAKKDDGSCNFSTVVFWAAHNQYQVGWNTYNVTSISIKVNEVNVGNITSVYGAAPACGAGGCISYKIKDNPSVKWSAAITLQNGTTVNKSGTVNASPNQECIALRVDQ